MSSARINYLAPFLFFLFSTLTVNSHAQPLKKMKIPKGCIAIAAEEYGLPPQLLHALYLSEYGEIGKVNKNSNGTYDMGPFQINSLWLKKFAQYGITGSMIINDARVNARVAAWMLKSEIIKANNQIWVGVGNYRSRTKKYHVEQVNRVASNYEAILRQDNNQYDRQC